MTAGTDAEVVAPSAVPRAVVPCRSEPVAGPLPTWTWGRFADLSADDVYDLLALRSAIFVVEQACVFLDADGADRAAWHLLGRTGDDAEGDAGGRLVAYLRCIDPGVKNAAPSIGRVVVAEDARLAGLGRALMEQGLARTTAAWPDAAVVINAQLRLAPFYRSLGFVAEGAPYDEDGIDHVAMRRPPVERDGTDAPGQESGLDFEKRQGKTR